MRKFLIILAAILFLYSVITKELLVTGVALFLGILLEKSPLLKEKIARKEEKLVKKHSL